MVHLLVVENPQNLTQLPLNYQILLVILALYNGSGQLNMADIISVVIFKLIQKKVKLVLENVKTMEFATMENVFVDQVIQESSVSTKMLMIQGSFISLWFMYY